MSFQFPDELLERARREAESRCVPLSRFIFRALAEYMDVLAAVDRVPVALKSGLPRKRILDDGSGTAPPPDAPDLRRRPRVKANFVDDLKKAG